MTVEGLIAELQEFDPELDVIIEVNGIRGTVEQINLMTTKDDLTFLIINDYPKEADA